MRVLSLTLLAPQGADGSPALDPSVDSDALFDSAVRLRHVLVAEEKALVEEVACGSGAASTETIADLRRQLRLKLWWTLLRMFPWTSSSCKQKLCHGTTLSLSLSCGSLLPGTSMSVSFMSLALRSVPLSVSCLTCRMPVTWLSGPLLRWCGRERPGPAAAGREAVICGNFLKHQKVEGSPALAKAPVFKSNLDGVAFRCQLRVAGLRSWDGAALDVKKAFLNAGLSEVLPSQTTIATAPPKALVRMKICPPQERWIVKGAFYGLNVSPRAARHVSFDVRSNHRVPKTILLKVKTSAQFATFQ